MRPGLRERVLLRLVPDPETGCLNWPGRVNLKGYGQVRLDGHNPFVHRIAYELLVGPIPDGLQLDHLCRNHACCAPEHLEPVTCRENLLRGETWAARNAAKTHCQRGHPYEVPNLRTSNGKRYCRQCDRDRYRADVEQLAAQRAEKAAS